MLNIQTERLDGHKARMTIEIEGKRFDSAKKKAARKISRQVNIRGFRKGKAPYRLVAQRVGEAVIIEEAVEEFGNEIYQQALEESEIAPYGPGELEDFKLDPAPTFVFSLSLQPEIDLKAFADVRVDYEPPVVADERVDEALEQMRQYAAEVLDDSLEVAVLGSRVVVDIDSEFIDGEEADEYDFDDFDDADDADDFDDEDEDAIPEPRKGDGFLHRREAQMILDPENDPVIEGFVEALDGAKLNEEIEFELTVPDEDRFEVGVGRQVSFRVTVKRIEAIRMPELDDEFARQVGKELGLELPDVAALRQHEREDMEQEALQEARTAYSSEVLDKIAEGADIVFSERMMEDYLDRVMDDLNQDLQRRGVDLDKFIQATRTTREAMREQRRDSAHLALRRNLTMQELADVWDINVSNEKIEESLDEFARRLGFHGESRNPADTPQMRQNIASNLLADQLTTCLCALGRGEDREEALAERAAQVKADRERARQQAEQLRAREEIDDEIDEEIDDETDSEVERVEDV